MVFSSLLPPIDIPGVNLVDFVFGECEKHVSSADHPVFTDSASGVSISLSELRSQTLRLASGLQKSCSIGTGDVVAIFAANSIIYPIAAYAIVTAGATCTPANPTYTAQELAHQLSNSRCKAVIVGDGLRETAVQALKIAKHPVEHILLMDESRTGASGTIFDVMDAEMPKDFFRRQAAEPGIDYTQLPAYMCYSSGTTGKPKGVVLTHRNMIANALQINGVKKLDAPRAHARDVFLGLAPFCHAYGLSYVLHSSVSLGGTVVVMAKYSFESFLAVIQRYRVTYGYLVPPIVCALSKDPRVDSYDLSTMATVLSGGAALSPTLIEATEQRLPGTKIVQGYGMTEMSPAITMLATVHSNAASIGMLMPGCDAMIIDDEGRELPENSPGELCFRGPNIMARYWNNAEATRDILDADGFLHTGDIGYIDSEGFFYITDRKKELIKYKGFQVAPSELEGLLAEHPDVEDAAVMAVYDDNQATEIPRAYIVLKDKNGGNEDGNGDDLARGQVVVDWLHERVARYKRLRGGFAIIDHIPRSPAGKIIRNSIRNIERVPGSSVLPSSKSQGIASSSLSSDSAGTASDTSSTTVVLA
ncbi:hypothetical protein LPJ56_001340 [Coemansia sp. RSA 2599]|nr:hypothetical protein LPJ75_000852 [Coemansia sp. RSA 2598]KAJ1828020.1 hypothetical protein LPJ56_001340 [Coemansia sp. RSA 2599]